MIADRLRRPLGSTGPIERGGGLSGTVRRVWLLVNIAITVALLPALFTGGGGDESTATTVLISAPITDTTLAPSTTTTTAAPPPTTAVTAPPTTAAPVKKAHTHAAAATTTTTAAPKPKPRPTTTTTTAPQPAPKPAAAQPSGNEESGRATWYELEGARAGICAHKTLPFGTIVTVTNTNTGSSIQCEVGDRGPFVDGYIIDLFRTDFEKLQPTSKGWFPARITW